MCFTTRGNYFVWDDFFQLSCMIRNPSDLLFNNLIGSMILLGGILLSSGSETQHIQACATFSYVNCPYHHTFAAYVICYVFRKEHNFMFKKRLITIRLKLHINESFMSCLINKPHLTKWWTFIQVINKLQTYNFKRLQTNYNWYIYI